MNRSSLHILEKDRGSPLSVFGVFLGYLIFYPLTVIIAFSTISFSNLKPCDHYPFTDYHFHL